VAAVTWSEFAAELRACGYNLGGNAVDGAVLGFDAAGNATVLKSGAQSPDDYVQVIRKTLVESLGWTAAQLEPPAKAPARPGTFRQITFGACWRRNDCDERRLIALPRRDVREQILFPRKLAHPRISDIPR
jgi:hypothetical protein